MDAEAARLRRADSSRGTKERVQQRAASLRKRADVCIWPWVGKSRSRRDERQGRSVLTWFGMACHLHALQAQHCHRTPRPVSQYADPLQHQRLPRCTRREPHVAVRSIGHGVACMRGGACSRCSAAFLLALLVLDVEQSAPPSLLNVSPALPHGQRKKHHPTATASIALSHWPLLACRAAVPGQQPSALRPTSVHCV
jgi:hypothetical protein